MDNDAPYLVSYLPSTGEYLWSFFDAMSQFTLMYFNLVTQEWEIV